MPGRQSGAWLYRGFTVRYHRRADPVPVALGADALWWAEVADTPEIAPLSGATLAIVQTAAEHAIDALVAQGHLSPPPAPAPIADPRRFLPLRDYLAARPATEGEVVLSFDALDTLLGRPLAPTARTTASFWTTTFRRTRWWRTSGWRALLRANDQVVVFTRSTVLPGE